MPNQPRELEAEAHRRQRAQDWAGAAATWKVLTDGHPQWEGGYPFYYMADCYTRLGIYADAECAYHRAIEIAREDDLFTNTLISLQEARRTGLVR